MKQLRLASLLTAAAVLASSSMAPAQSTTDVTVALSWLRNAQYAPLYVADVKGYFKEEGLNLVLMDGGPGKNPVSTVGAGQADFGLTSGTFIFSARVAPEPVDVVAIGAIRQRSPYGYITLTEKGAPKPQPKDLEGKTVGIQTDGEVFLKAMAEENGLDYDSIKIQIVQGGLEPLLAGAVDYITGFVHNQPYQFEMEAAKPDAPAALKNKEWQAMLLADYAVPSYNDIIFAKGATLTEKPELARGFLKALARGMAFMAAHPEETAQLTAEYPGQLDPLEKAAWGLPVQNALNVSADTAEHGFLWMRPEVWEGHMGFIHKNGLLARVIPGAEVMSNAFNPGVKSQ